MTRAHRIFTIALLAAGQAGVPVYAADSASASQSDGEKRPVRVVIYPILVEAPIFGAKINLPTLPSLPGGGAGADNGSAVSGSTDIALNAAYMAGLAIETNRIFIEANGTYAALSADRKAPRVNVKSDTLLFLARGGVRVFKGFSATAGVRYIQVDLNTSLDLPIIGTTLTGHTKPDLWDPMIGVDWRGRHGRFGFSANFQGGGFGVGTDTDLSAEARADLRFARFFEIRAGYQFIYYKMTVANVTIGPFSRELVSEQTLHGPSIGIGIVF